MEYLKIIEAILKRFKQLFWFTLVGVLLVVIYFKNGAIKHLREEVAKKPKIEYVYQHYIDTITDSIPVPYKVVEYKDKILIESDTVPVKLTQVDSAQIAGAYIQLYSKYNETVVYDDILKDDNTAYIQLKEKVRQNTIFDRNLIFEDRTPVVNITNTVTKQDKTTSIVGGLGANIGREYNALNLELGVVTPKNSVYLFEYDPVNKAYGGKVILPIFNFSSK